MAEDWREMHTFVIDEVMLASYFEDMRQNYHYIREPQFVIARGKAAHNDQLATGSGASPFNWTGFPTSLIDTVTINATGRDLLVVSNPTLTPGNTSNTVAMSVRMDGAAILEGAAGQGMALWSSNNSNFFTTPIIHFVSAPSVGEHIFQLSWSQTGGGVGNIQMVLGPRFFLAVLEL